MKQTRFFACILCMIFGVSPAFAQDTVVVVPTVRDTIPKDSVVTRVQGIQFKSDVVADTLRKKSNIDTISKKPNHPRRAAIRSALIPGWGQAYNKKYWKVPIVYAALGITGYIFFDNLQTYKDVKYAYKVAATKDTANYANVPDYLQQHVIRGNVNGLDNYRREVRRNIDYSVLIFMLFWGLNVIDATVDAHLKEFDVSPTLSMKFKPQLPNGTYGSVAGLTLKFDIHSAKSKLKFQN
jgi:hypothetical protein